MTQLVPGRACPARYRYGAAAIAHAAERTADVLYVVGGLYGNVPALDAVEVLVQGDPGSTICFNGDFNWFNVDDESFTEVNRRVLEHHATLGNVEAELGSDSADAGCGCAYPPSVANEVVERSNRIHARLKTTAARQPVLVAQILALPMVARYRVGDCRIGVVHGDADSLAGWRFDVGALAEPDAAPWIASAFETAQVDVFASTHTCLPTMRHFVLATARTGLVVNNGAAGMPNLWGQLYGLCTRLGLSPSPHPTLYEEKIAGVFVALVPVRYDAVRWQAHFLANWPADSPAWLSYFGRISQGPSFTADQVTAKATA